MTKKFWDKFYENFNIRKASNFAKFVKKEFIKKNKKLLEIGCGNGRDTFYLSDKVNITSIDKSKEAINQNLNFLKPLKKNKIFFKELDATKLRVTNFGKFDYIYARFFLHTINLNSEKKIFKNLDNILNKRGLIFLEFRTINDPLFLKGKKLSKYERWTDHYRRFIDRKIFMSQSYIKNKFNILYCVEKKGLAKFKNDNPSVCRIILEKK